MTHTKNNLFMMALATSLLSGCTQRMGDLTIISTKNIDISKSAIDLNSGVNVYGEDCKYNPPLMHQLIQPNLETAIDDALSKANANVMVDEVTEWKVIWVVLGNIQCIKVKGIGYKMITEKSKKK